MKVIILAGGKTKLPGKLKNIPESLIEINGKPLLEYQLDLLKKYKLDDIRLSFYYKADEILKYLKKKDKKAKISGKKGKVAGLEYIIQPKNLGIGGAIRYSTRDLKKDFILMYGDVLTNINLSAFIKFYKKNTSEPRHLSFPSIFKIPSLKIPIPLKKRVSYEDILGLMAVFYTQNVSDFGLVKVRNNRISQFTEKPDYQYSGYINAGIYILSPKVFQTKIFKSKTLSRHFSIEKMVFPKLVEKHQLLAYVHRGLWTDIGSEKGLEKAESIAERLKEEEK